MNLQALADRRVVAKRKLQYLDAALRSGLSHVEVRVLSAMVVSFDRGFGCSASRETLAAVCGCSVETVKRSVRELRRCGWIWSQFQEAAVSVHIPVWPPDSAVVVGVGGVMGDPPPGSRVTPNSRQYQFKKEAISNVDGPYRLLMEAGLCRRPVV